MNEIATNSKIVEMYVSREETYVDEDRKTQSPEFMQPYDYDIREERQEYIDILTNLGECEGPTVQGNLGSTLLPYSSNALKKSANEHIQIIINGKGTPYHRAIGVAKEFAHTVLFLRGSNHSLLQKVVNEFINERKDQVKKKFGYDQ